MTLLGLFGTLRSYSAPRNCVPLVTLLHGVDDSSITPLRHSSIPAIVLVKMEIYSDRCPSVGACPEVQPANKPRNMNNSSKMSTVHCLHPYLSWRQTLNANSFRSQQNGIVKRPTKKLFLDRKRNLGDWCELRLRCKGDCALNQLRGLAVIMTVPFLQRRPWLCCTKECLSCRTSNTLELLLRAS